MEMRRQYSQLQERSASAQSQMERTQRLLDRIRRENVRKCTEIDKLQAEFTSLGDRLKMLENKAMEVEKLEITVDSLKKSLEASQQELRDAERQLRMFERKLEEKEKMINSTETKMKEFEKMTSDLKLQIKEEVIKNVNLEMRIENADRLRQALADKDVEIERMKKQVEEAELLAQHARKCLREERERRKYLENIDRDIAKMRNELLIVSSENTTLKRLLAAKDILLREKLQTIQNLQNALRDHVTPLQFRNVMKSVEIQNNDVTEDHRSHRRHSDVIPDRSLDTNSTDHKSRLLKTILKENNSRLDTTAPQRPKTAIVKPRLYHNSFSDFRSESPTSSDVISMNSDVSSGLRRTQSMRGASISGSRTTMTSSSVDCIQAWTAKRGDNKSSWCNGGEESLHKVVWTDRQTRNTELLELGDRVVFETTPKKGDQCKEYNTGVVKYIGCLDNEREPTKIYVGVKLDEPDGDTDGLYKGKRYFRVSARYGKFIRIDRIRSIFDKQTGEFRSAEPASRSSQAQISRQQKSH